MKTEITRVMKTRKIADILQVEIKKRHLKAGMPLLSARQIAVKYLDHFFCFNSLRLSVEAVFLLTQIPLNTKVLQISLTNAIPPENFTFSPFRTPSGTIFGQFSEGEKSAAFGLSELSVLSLYKVLMEYFINQRSRSSSYSHYLLPPKSKRLSF